MYTPGEISMRPLTSMTYDLYPKRTLETKPIIPALNVEYEGGPESTGYQYERMLGNPNEVNSSAAPDVAMPGNVTVNGSNDKINRGRSKTPQKNKSKKVKIGNRKYRHKQLIMLSVEERLRRKDELIKNGYKVERNASWGPNLNKMYMSMKAKTPKKKSWAQSIKDEGLISGTMDKMGITNPYAKVAAEFTPLIPGIGNYISAANAITD